MSGADIDTLDGSAGPQLAGNRLEGADPLADGRMGVPQRLGALLEALDRVDDVEVLRRAVRDLEDVRVRRDLGEGALEPVRVARQLDRRRVGEVLAAAPRGFEPRFTDPKSAVLPLDEGPAIYAEV